VFGLALSFACVGPFAFQSLPPVSPIEYLKRPLASYRGLGMAIAQLDLTNRTVKFANRTVLVRA
jgi:hypothetical protein